MGDTTSLVPGFPIRTSSDQRSVDSSPRHNAASHVLHRPLMPRHPPCALKHLQHKKPQSRHLSHFKHRNTKLHHNKPTTVRRPRGESISCQLDARNHYPRIKHHTPPPKLGATTRLPPHTGAREPRACCLKAQQCAWWPAPPQRGGNQKFLFVCAPELAPLRIRPVTGNESIQRIAWTTADPTRCGAGQVSWCSLERR